MISAKLEPCLGFLHILRNRALAFLSLFASNIALTMGIASLSKNGNALIRSFFVAISPRAIEASPSSFRILNVPKVRLKSYLLSVQLIFQQAKHIFLSSARAWCFTQVDFENFLKILVDSLSVLDYNFFYYTVKRKKATLRTSNKRGRPSQKVVSVIDSYYLPFNQSVVEKVVYDTGLEKRGISLLLGGE